MIPASVHQSLKTVAGLKRGRTSAPETDDVKPVSEEHIEVVLNRVPEVVADMIRLQRFTGCRPGEATLVRPGDIDRTSDVWEYRPHSHKTEHQDKERIVMIGPRAQEVLLPYLLRADDAYCFSPQESEERRRCKMHEERQTPLNQGNIPMHRGPSRFAERYTVDAYRRAIRRACEAAKIPIWSPNQLRHTAATDIRREFGLDAAQVILGHASADVTQVYAEADRQLAAGVARKLG